MENTENTPTTPPTETKQKKGAGGRPKPMKTNTFRFRKLTVANWIEIVIGTAAVIFVAVIAIKLIDAGKTIYPEFDYYETDEATLANEYVMESSDLVFELDPATTQFTVRNKHTGKVWHSNPEDVDADGQALVREKNNMKSTFLVKYSTVNGTDDTYDTFTKSIQRKTYSIEQNGNEIAVHYTIGEIEREYLFPLAIYEDELEKFQEGLTKSQINTIARAYHKYTYDGFKNAGERDEMLSKYPELKNQALYLVFENLQTFLKEQVEKMFTSNGYTMEDFLRHKELYKETNIKEVPAFNVTAIYKLDGNRLSVEVPFDEVSYRPTYPITQLSVLPYFAAGGVNDSGYMLVPEGGGNIINFNNGKTKQNTYYADMYGWDYATGRKYVNTETRVAFPVFGSSDNSDSFICIIEEGSAYSGITADIAGKLNSYNFVRADYQMLHREQFEVSNRNVSAQYSYEPSLPKGEKIKQTYVFLNEGSYVDMAKSYREYLFAGAPKTANTAVPVAVDIIGAIDKVQQVAGMPKTMPYELTSYAAAADIINEIDGAGVKNAHVRLSGFINEGLNQTYLNKVRFITELGGENGFAQMVESAKKTSAKIHLDAAVQTAYRSTFLGEGFNRFTAAARFVSDEVCELPQYSPIWYGILDDLDEYYLVKPTLADANTANFIKTVQNYNIGFSFADNGYLLSADYNDNHLVSRSAAAQMQVARFKEIKDNNMSLMIRKGNAYAVPYADFITDVSLFGNNYSILDKPVPFYQIALQGYKNYAGDPLNISFELEDLILQSAQTAAGLSFVFMDAKETKLQETSFSEYFATNFDSWKDRFVAIYNDYNARLSKVAGSCIADFAYVTDTVTRTEFENGYEVYVNFGYADYTTAAGTKVASRDYVLVKKGE